MSCGSGARGAGAGACAGVDAVAGGIGAPEPPTDAPQTLQKAAPGFSGAPHRGQAGCAGTVGWDGGGVTGLPHWTQNVESSGISWPHFGHFMDAFNPVGPSPRQTLPY